MLIKTEANVLFPLIHTVKVLGTEQGSDDFEVNHFLQTYDVEVWQLVLELCIWLVAVKTTRVGKDNLSEVKIVRQ